MNYKSAYVISSLYSKYLDEPAIVYDLAHKRLLMYLPDEKYPKMAFKGGAWLVAVKIKPEFQDEVTLNQVYFEFLKKLKDIAEIES